MRKIYFLLLVVCLSVSAKAQIDTLPVEKHDSIIYKADTIKIGSVIIIKSHDKSKKTAISMPVTKKPKNINENVSTNWWIVDLGFANYTDKTNYTSIPSQQFSPGSNKDRFNLRTGKSVNVNIWVFMQRVNVIKHVVNLKYGLGVEFNNYRYETNVLYKKSPIKIIDTTLHFSKNKLAADYITIPLMLNFDFTPKNEYKKSFGLSAGVSAGYLYSSRQKYVTTENGKQKTKGNIGLEMFKISYIAELKFGPVKLYGSLASKSMFKEGLDQTPFNVGLRFSNW